MPVITIDQESKNLAMLSTDLDNFRRRYTMKEVNPSETIIVNFSAPSIICFEEFRFFLLKNSTRQSLTRNYYYRPDYLSYDMYGTTNLWAMLLFINDISNIESFDKDTVLIPSSLAVYSIAVETVKRNPSQEIVQLTEVLKKNNAKLFYSFPSKINVQPTQKESNIPAKYQDPFFVKEYFTLDIISIRNRYVPLSNTPIPESMQLKVKNGPSYIYGKHYIVSKERNKNIVTWDPKRMTTGTGMVSILQETDELEIQYAKKEYNT